MFNAKIVSSLEKVFLKDDVSILQSISRISALKGEQVSFQIVLNSTDYEKYNLEYRITSVLKEIDVRRVEYVPCRLPVYEEKMDQYYITDRPGLFPDILVPIEPTDKIKINKYTNTVLWIMINIPKNAIAGDHVVNIELCDNEKMTNAELKINIEVYDEVLPDANLIFSEWLYADCIATYHNVKIFSNEHWNLINEYIKTAKKIGINMILTPIFTVPLDTEIGGERPTVQLVDVIKEGKKYNFKYNKFEKWIKMCKKNGIHKFEISHLFSQWGAEYTPKIVVEENGEKIKLFGWNIKANDIKYKNFLDQFLPSIKEELIKLNIYDDTFFHISDEPSKKRQNDFNNYKYAKEIICQYIEEEKIIDALSDLDYYEQGLIKNPIVATNKIEPFIKSQKLTQNRWCYYCCSQSKDVSNKFMAMPSYRTRIIGVQLYKYNIKGFLHWGYNFYYTMLSKDKIDPYKVTDADMEFPSGDAFSVYPFKNKAIESIRAIVFHEGIQDMARLELLEKKIGRKEVLKLIENVAQMNITFKNYPHSQYFLSKLKYEVLNKLKNI